MLKKNDPRMLNIADAFARMGREKREILVALFDTNTPPEHLANAEQKMRSWGVDDRTLQAFALVRETLKSQS